LIKMVAGAITPTSGTITIDGKTFEKLTPEEAKKNGVEVIYQGFNLVPSMTCAENVFLNVRTGSGKFLVNSKERSRKAKELFTSLGVDIDPDRPVGTYSTAYRQIVEISKAISKNPKILVMDEPTAPLTVDEVGLLFNIVRKLKASGVTIIYISHRIEELFEIGDRVSVLRDGQYIDTKNIKDTNRQELINLMVGRQLTESYPVRSSSIGKEVLRVEHLYGNGDEDINFALHEGEILGIAGLVGAGRTELMELIYGVKKIESGNLYLYGKKTEIKDTADALKKGIGMIPEDRKTKGVFLNQDIKWNTVISAEKEFTHNGIVDSKKENSIAHEFLRSLDIRTPSLNQLVGNLSGGNQQKVVLAKAMAPKAKILIFDEPTRGIDVGAKQEIYVLMNQLVAQGNAILMVSSDMPEVLGMSDRIVVLCEGHQAGIVEKDQFDQAYILDLASGTK
jgi:ribose transport system ATP-binding protein